MNRKINKYKKIIILLFILTIILIQSSVIAGTTGLEALDKYAQQQGTSTKFVEKVNVILGIVQMVGSVIAVICLIVLGIKYMMGSVEEKAEYKKTLMPYMLGAIMVLGISNFIKLVYKLATGLL